MHARPPSGPGSGVRRPALVLVGPSAAGKSALAAALTRLGVVTVHPTWTTRPPRPDEVAAGCVEHRFVSERRFDRMAAAGFFAEVVRPFDGAHRYGVPPVPRRPAGPPGTVDLLLLRARYLDRAWAHLGPTVVYQVEASPPVLAARLAARGTGPAETLARLAFDAEDTAVGRRLADRIFDNEDPLGSLIGRTLAALAVDFGTAAGQRLVTAGSAA
jgi:guanylate kinase